MTNPISPADGPVAVTGASGYIGAWTTRDLMRQGYHVRATVRDTLNPAKVDHLTALNDEDLKGSLELFEADLHNRGSYDDIFAGCSGVFHVGATVGYHHESPREVYDGCFTEVDHVIDSVVKSKSVRRFVFTSSFAAVWHPEPQGYVYTEKDWCSDNPEGYKGRWTEESIDTNRSIAYAMAKANVENLAYKMAEESGTFTAVGVLPLHVLGPLMSANHDQPSSWQNCIRDLLRGEDFNKTRGGRMLWNVTDVRDVATAHRLAAERTEARNGSRYILAAENRSGEMLTWQLQKKLQKLFPDINKIGGEEMEGLEPAKYTYDAPRSYCQLAMEELGLEPYAIDETLKATGDAYFRLGMI